MKRVLLSTNFLLLTVFAPALHGATSFVVVQKSLTNHLKAIEENNFFNFIADVTESVKMEMSKERLEALNKFLGARLKEGYVATYLCRLTQQGNDVHLWKLTFNDKHDDVIIRMAFQDDKIAGFFLQ